MGIRKGFFYFAIVSLSLFLFPYSVFANITTGSWYMDESNVLSDGVNYGRVDISADDITGKVAFSVTAYDSMYNAGTPDNFGIQVFGFNYNSTITSDPETDWSWNLPSSWSIKLDQNVSDFGVFSIYSSGTGSTRQNPLTFSFTLPTLNDAVANNFAVSSTNGYFFVAHVAGFPNTEGQTSHYIAGNTPVTIIPTPGAIFLGGIGVSVVGWLRRRRIF